MSTSAPTEQGTTARIAARGRALVARVPLALWILLALGVVLRVALELSYRPLVMTFADSATYINMANGSMFADPARTVGYSVFLDGAHAFSNSIMFPIQIQHLLGLAAGVVLYATVRRLGAPLWIALVAAAAILLSLDLIVLEHAIASESVFTFLYVCSLYAAVRALEDGRPLWRFIGTRELWLVAAGLLLGAATWVRAASLPVILLLGLWVLLAIPGRWYARVGRAALATGSCAVLLFVYFSLNSGATGTFGLIQTSGWGVYSRTAQFADCSKFTPPEGTEALCETTPSEDRNGPDFYSWNPKSPAQRTFGYPPEGNAQLGEFGWAVVRAQPVDYARVVANDFLRYFFPRLNAGRPYSESGYETLNITQRTPVVEEDVRLRYAAHYYDTPGPVELSGFANTLADIQQVVRVHPFLLFQAAVFGLLGMIWARGHVRAGIALLGGSAVLMLAVAAANTYNARYAIPVNGPLIAAGALGLWVVLERYRAHASAALRRGPSARRAVAGGGDLGERGRV